MDTLFADGDGRRNRPLTALQMAFCREYVKDLDARAAALRAGYHEMSVRLCDVDAWPALPKFARVIAALQSEGGE